MRLPKEFNLYKINEYLGDLLELATKTDEYNNAKYSVEEICIANLLNLKVMHAKILHLELAIDEVLKVPGVSDE